MVEIPVASVSEAVAGHLDRRAEVLVVVEQVGELAALALAQQRRRDHVPVGVKLGRQIGPVEVVHPLVESTCRFAEVEHCFSFRLEGFRVHSPASVWFNDHARRNVRSSTRTGCLFAEKVAPFAPNSPKGGSPAHSGDHRDRDHGGANY